MHNELRAMLFIKNTVSRGESVKLFLHSPLRSYTNLSHVFIHLLEDKIVEMNSLRKLK